MRTIYENYDFYQSYIPQMIFCLIFLSLGTFGWPFIKKFVKKKPLFVRLFILFISVVTIISMIPETADIPTVHNKQYETKTGELTNVYIHYDTDTTTNKVSSGTYKTEFTVDHSEFTILGKYTNFEKIKGLTIKVYYFPYSHKVVKIDIPLNKSNALKAADMSFE